MEEWENCNLGHINLAYVDNEELFRCASLMTRFLIRATFGDIDDPRQREVVDRNRRIGVGVLGLQEWLINKGSSWETMPFSSRSNLLIEKVYTEIAQTAREYAHELRIPAPIKNTTIAPTGTIAKMAGVTEGMHPVFAKRFIRNVRYSNSDPNLASLSQFHQEPDLYSVNTTVVSFPCIDPIMERVKHPERVASVNEIPLRTLLHMQAHMQRIWADNAISFTASVDPDETTVEELAGALALWGPRLKGTTVFPEMNRPQMPYVRLDDEDEVQGAYDIESSVDEDCATGACPVK